MSHFAARRKRKEARNVVKRRRKAETISARMRTKETKCKCKIFWRIAEEGRERYMKCFKSVLGRKGREEQLARHYNPERGKMEGKQECKGTGCSSVGLGERTKGIKCLYKFQREMDTKWRRKHGLGCRKET